MWKRTAVVVSLLASGALFLMRSGQSGGSATAGGELYRVIFGAHRLAAGPVEVRVTGEADVSNWLGAAVTRTDSGSSVKMTVPNELAPFATLGGGEDLSVGVPPLPGFYVRTANAAAVRI